MNVFLCLRCNKPSVALLSIFVALLACFTACTPKNQALSIPEFPLSQASIANALQESGLPWAVKESYSPQGFTPPNTFTLYMDDLQIGFLSSAGVDGERAVFISFLAYFGESPYIIAYNPPREDWEEIIIFLTLLCGGFDNKHQVFDYFNSEIDTVTRHLIAPPPGWIPGLSTGHYFEEGTIWERVINNTYFHITIGRPVGSQNEYFRAIRVFSDSDIFGLPEQ